MSGVDMYRWVSGGNMMHEWRCGNIVLMEYDVQVD